MQVVFLELVNLLRELLYLWQEVSFKLLYVLNVCEPVQSVLQLLHCFLSLHVLVQVINAHHNLLYLLPLTAEVFVNSLDSSVALDCGFVH